MIVNSELQERMAEQMEFALSQTPEAPATENAKLRELVRELWQYIYIGTARDGQRLHDRTRELGIEVEG